MCLVGWRILPKPLVRAPEGSTMLPTAPSCCLHPPWQREKPGGGDCPKIIVIGDAEVVKNENSQITQRRGDLPGWFQVQPAAIPTINLIFRAALKTFLTTWFALWNIQF